MNAFEDAGRAIDREIKKLHEFFESEVKPTTQRRAIDALRAASAKFTEMANKLERQANSEEGKGQAKE